MANGAFINLTRPRRCVGSSRGALCEPETKIWAARLFPEAPAEDPERTSSKHLRFFSASEIPALVPQNYVVTDLAPKVWCSQTDPKENSGCCRGKSKRQGFTLEEVRSRERRLSFTSAEIGCWMCWAGVPQDFPSLQPWKRPCSWVLAHHEVIIWTMNQYLNFELDWLFFPGQTILLLVYMQFIYGIWTARAPGFRPVA